MKSPMIFLSFAKGCAAVAALFAVAAASAVDSAGASPSASPKRSADPMLSWTPPATNQMRDLAAVLEPLREELKFPALAAAIVEGRSIAAAGATGTRKIGTDDPVTLQDKFHIGSITKSVTAVLAVLNAEKIPLDTTVAEVFPSWDLAGPTGDITLRLLLQNRSGLASRPSERLWARTFELEGPYPAQRREFLEAFLKEPPASKPGEVYRYSNQGFALAGAMIETRLGTPWETLVERQIFDPLHLRSAGFGPLAARGQPQGHQFRDGDPEALPPGDNPPATAPAGAIHMSTPDLAGYVAFHLAAARGEIPALKPFLGDLYVPPAGSDYAMGWLVIERGWAGGRALTHTGSNTMYYTVIWIAPGKDFAILVNTNIGDRDGAKTVAQGCDRVAGKLIEYALKKAR